MVRISNCFGKNAPIVNGSPETSGMIYNKFYIGTEPVATWKSEIPQNMTAF